MGVCNGIGDLKLSFKKFFALTQTLFWNLKGPIHKWLFSWNLEGDVHKWRLNVLCYLHKTNSTSLKANLIYLIYNLVSVFRLVWTFSWSGLGPLSKVLAFKGEGQNWGQLQDAWWNQFRIIHLQKKLSTSFMFAEKGIDPKWVWLSILILVPFRT